MLSHLCQTPGSHSRFIFLPSYFQAVEFHLLQKSEIHPLLSIPTAPAPTQPFNSRHVDCGHGVQKWYLVPHNQQRIRPWHLPRHPIRAPLQCPGACRVIPSFPAQALGSLPPSSWHAAPSSCHLCHTLRCTLQPPLPQCAKSLLSALLSAQRPAASLYPAARLTP